MREKGWGGCLPASSAAIGTGHEHAGAGAPCRLWLPKWETQSWNPQGETSVTQEKAPAELRRLSWLPQALC